MRTWTHEKENLSTKTTTRIGEAAQSRGYKSDRLPGDAGNDPTKRIPDKQARQIIPATLDFGHNSPYPPTPKPYLKRLSKMTMAGSLHFKDGVVVFADQLISRGQTNEALFASYQCKLRYTEIYGVYSAIMVGSGNDHVISAVIDDTFQNLARNLTEHGEKYVLPPDTPKIVLEEALNRVYEKITPSDGATFILALHVRDAAIRTFRADDKVVHRSKPLDIIGIGENSLMSFISDHLYRDVLDYREAVSLAILLGFEAKRYCPQYCGGLTDVAVLRTTQQPIMVVSEKEVGEVETFFARNLRDPLILSLKESARIIG